MDQLRNGFLSDANDAVTLACALVRVAHGDRIAFGEVYRRTSAKLFGICLRITPSRHEAEEALQETYLAVWRRAGSFDETRGTAMTWLMTIAHNRAVDRLRAARPIATEPIVIADHIADERPLPCDALEVRECEDRLAECLSGIDAFDAQLIRSAFLEGSTYAELAQRTALPLGTVKSRVRRALPKLRAYLNE